ncbi:alpha/beta hydrolase [Flammeovirga sp. SubArs3]|uniref:alpha/beta hydrolase n=1 Tax=Flammeovirga sp. SubArs3 TaxID=2995316 RepID=UPI00248AE535|nr:alpha/beta hydrolase [Flammeovirga sp. SubArs3]
MSSSVIYIPAENKQFSQPIILIHGALFSAEAWRGNFLEFFPKQGYDTYAISLSGHGNQGNKLLLNLYGIDDFTEDVVQLITSLKEKPILIGHSMGGLVAQMVAQKVSLTSVILLAAVPPYGVFRPMLQHMFSAPISLTKFAASTLFPFWKFFKTEAPEGIYSTLPTREVQLHVNKNIQRESLKAMIEMLIRDFNIEPKKVNCPMHHIGFKDDKIIFPEDVIKTASFYQQEYKIFDNMAHAFMFEPDWEIVGKYISDWMTKNH